MKLTKEIRIALVAIVGILVMYFGVNFLKGINLFSTNNTYYMTFDDIQGMGASTPIYADGYKVGTVAPPTISTEKKDINMSMSKNPKARKAGVLQYHFV